MGFRAIVLDDSPYPCGCVLIQSYDECLGHKKVEETKIAPHNHLLHCLASWNDFQFYQRMTNIITKTEKAPAYPLWNATPVIPSREQCCTYILRCLAWIGVTYRKGRGVWIARLSGKRLCCAWIAEDFLSGLCHARLEELPDTLQIERPQNWCCSQQNCQAISI